MRDFTLTIYKKLLGELVRSNYVFMTFAEFMESKPGEKKLIILRHDVDRLPGQALRMAQIEHEMGVKTSYYFRSRRQNYDDSIIRAIAAMGHEIGYHYEDLSSARGDFVQAYDAFEKNLSSLRKLTEVKTICMHGSPLGKIDNRKLWEKYKYQDFDIIGEPYFDVDFSKVSYLTDTGRRWDGEKVNIRDTIKAENSVFKKLKIRRTVDLIKAIDSENIPNKLLLNVHPHRWFNFGLSWVRELIFQNFKNILKALLKYLRDE